MAKVILARYSLLRKEEFAFPKMTSEYISFKFGLGFLMVMVIVVSKFLFY